MSYNILFKEALKCFDEGDFENAEAYARQIFETVPDNPDVLNLLGLTAQAKGLHQEACSYFSGAIRSKNDDPSLYFNLAFSLKASKQYYDALYNFNKVLSLAPQVKETYNEIACIYESLSDIKNAREYWDKALQYDNNYASAEINLANSYRLDDIEYAISKLNDLSEKYPEEALVWYNLAWIYYNRSEYDNSLQYALKALKLYPTSDAIRYLIGLSYMGLKQEAQAKEILLESESLNPNNPEPKLCLADIFSRNNEFEEAEKRYKRLMEIDDKNYAVYSNYAEMLHRQKRLLEAMDIYRKAVIIFPSSADVSNNLGAVLRELEEYDEALGLFFNALALNPNLVEASVNIWETLVLLSKDNEQTAKDIADNWYKSYPDNQFAKYARSALRGENIENNKIFTEKLFDNFADNYEMVMQNLDYTAPMVIGRIAGHLEGRIADLGCGSGLVGMVVKKAENYLIGVDISAKMLEKAKQKNIYNELIKSDIIDFLKDRSDFNWVIAADVLGYIGKLDEFIKNCKGKNLIFSIEINRNTADYRLQSNGRFNHNPDYVEKLLIKYGFYDIYKEEFELRTENFIPVNSMIFKAFGIH